MPLLLAQNGDVQSLLTSPQLRWGLWFAAVLIATGLAGWGATAASSSGCTGSGHQYEAGIRALHRGLLGLVVLTVLAVVGTVT